MLGAHITVAQTAAFQNAAFQNFFTPRSQFQHPAALTGPFTQNGMDTLIHGSVINIFRQKLGNKIAGFLQQTQ